jgi:putative nucleotidyltransferase with HDIG domain
VAKHIRPENIRKVTRHIFDLPTLPSTVAKMIEVIDHPSTSAHTLNTIVSSDQALAAQVLRLANSAYYGFPRKINTITLAIVVVGFETLKNFGLSSAVLDRFARFNHDVPFDIYLFWEHSICTAVASRMLARETGYQISGEAFAAGLLHDLGKYVISIYFRELFEKVVEQMIDDDMPMYQVEEQHLAHVNHAQIGAWLVEKWNLSESIVSGIKHHHRPDLANSHQQLAWIVHYANYLTKKFGVGFSGDMSTTGYRDGLGERLGLRLTNDALVDEDYYFRKLSAEIEKEQELFSLIRQRTDTEKNDTNSYEPDWSEHAASYA